LQHRIKDLRHQIRYLAQDVGHRIGEKYAPKIPNPKCC
jgi:hypothetical protein